MINLYRLGRFTRNAIQVWRFEDQSSAVISHFGGLRELLLLEPHFDAPLLANLLLDEGTPVNSMEIGRALGRFLQDRHQPSGLSLDQYVRELIGGSFGLIATLDAYPPGFLSDEDYSNAVEFGARWIKRLGRGQAVRIHGDFHPWNVFVHPTDHRVFTTGGLHTSYGLPEDDVACMATNLHLMDRWKRSSSRLSQRV